MTSGEGPLLSLDEANENVEFHPERVIPARLAASLALLANADGGTVPVGVGGNGEVVGLKGALCGPRRR